MLECAIVGGGIHGTYLLQRLLEETGLERENVVILDPHERLLESFRQKAMACEMTAMRSTFVHHVGTEPFGLENYAEANGREQELLPTPGYPRRPSLSLFLDYAAYVIERNELEERHRQVAVESIQWTADNRPGLTLETTAGTIDTRHCVLAIGNGTRYRVPEWADGVDEVSHVWDEDFSLETMGTHSPNKDTHTVIVGGGITAGQLATCLCTRLENQPNQPRDNNVTLLSRRPLERSVVEAEPLWINWKHIERELHTHPPGSSERLEVIDEARNDGTMPPYVHDRLEATVDRGDLTVRRGTVTAARTVDENVRLLLEDGGCVIADRVVLATGFAPVFEHPFVDRIATTLDLERGVRGMPVLCDETLAWQQNDGRGPSKVFVTGALAAGTVGPLAGTIVGARRSADRIVPALESPVRHRTSGYADTAAHP